MPNFYSNKIIFIELVGYIVLLLVFDIFLYTRESFNTNISHQLFNFCTYSLSISFLFIYCISVVLKDLGLYLTHLLLKQQLKENRFYTRGTLRGVRISQLAKIPTHYCDWLELRKGVIIWVAQNTALFVDLNTIEYIFCYNK